LDLRRSALGKQAAGISLPTKGGRRERQSIKREASAGGGADLRKRETTDPEDRKVQTLGTRITQGNQKKDRNKTHSNKWDRKFSTSAGLGERR